MGYPDIDNILGGLRKTAFYVIAGRPGTGKTTLALNIAAYVANHDAPVLISSLEMPGEQLAARLQSALSKVPFHAAERLQFEGTQIDDYERATKKVAGYPIYIIDSPSGNINKLAASIRRAISKYNIKLVIVDYLQRLSTTTRHNNKTTEVTELSNKLKNAALENNIPLIAACQLSRNIEHRKDKDPSLSDLRDSGSIEQDADVVMTLALPKPIANMKPSSETLSCWILKNRYGATGKVDLRFWMKYFKIVSPEYGRKEK